MNAQERLAAAFGTLTHRRGPSVVNCGSCAEDAAGALAADPHFAQDIEDGAALRRLREALPDGRGFQCGWSSDVTGFYCHDDDSEWGGDIRAVGHGPTIAAAADKAREAIEADR